MSLNQIQAAFINAAVAKVDTKGGGRWVDRVVRVADKQTIRGDKPQIKLSFRTAQKLKQEGVI